jgi:probable HAF family extracellular repeat protein
VNLSAPEVPIALPDLGGNSASANAVNDLGQIAGTATTNDGIYATVFGVDTPAKSLGQLNPAFTSSQAYGINNAGLVVGSAQREYGSGRTSAFIYDLNASTPVMLDLNTLIDCGSDVNARWDLAAAKAINNNGEILGYGSFGTAQKAFLLRPSADQTSAPVQCAPLEPEFVDKNAAGSAPIVALLLWPLLVLWRRRRN